MASTKGRLGRWFRPVLFGTLLGAWAFAIASALLYSTDWVPSWIPGVGLIKWTLFLVVCTVVGFVHALVLGLVDVLLLSLKVRELPTGGRAWGTAFAGPIAVGLVLKLWPSIRLESISMWMLSMLIPMIGISLALRLGFGKRP